MSAGSDRRREAIFNRARVFAHDRLLVVFPILPEAQAATKPDSADGKLNQHIAHLLLQLDPWVAALHKPKTARKGQKQQQQQPQQLVSRGGSQGSEVAVVDLVNAAARLQQASMLQEQGGDGRNRIHGGCLSLGHGSEGTPLPLAVQRLLEYAMHVIRGVGGPRSKRKRGHGEEVTASDLRTALHIALKLISQVRSLKCVAISCGVVLVPRPP